MKLNINFNIFIAFVIHFLSPVLSEESQCYDVGQNNKFCFKYLGTMKSDQILIARSKCKDDKMYLLEIRNRQVQDALKEFKQKYSANFTNNNLFLLNLKIEAPSEWYNLKGILNPGILIQNPNQISGSPNRYVYLNVMSRKSWTLTGELATTKLQYLCSQDVQTTSELPWYSARNYCLSKGEDLLIVNDANQNINVPPGKYWVGVCREFWIWENSNSRIKYSNWRDDCPKSVDSNAGANRVLIDSNTNDFSWSNENIIVDSHVICMNGSVEDSMITNDGGLPLDINTPMSVTNIPALVTKISASVVYNHAMSTALAVLIPLLLIVIVILVIVIIWLARKLKSNQQHSQLYESYNAANNQPDNRVYAGINVDQKQTKGRGNSNDKRGNSNSTMQ